MEGRILPRRLVGQLCSFDVSFLSVRSKARITMPKPPFVLMPDHPAYTEAIEALRRYHESRDLGLNDEEVERLRLLAEALFQAVADYQLRALGHSDETFQ